jgi:hypothetical protein
MFLRCNLSQLAASCLSPGSKQYILCPDFSVCTSRKRHFHYNQKLPSNAYYQHKIKCYMGAVSRNPSGTSVGKIKLGGSWLWGRYNLIVHADDLMYFNMRSITHRAKQTWLFQPSSRLAWTVPLPLITIDGIWLTVYFPGSNLNNHFG